MARLAVDIGGTSIRLAYSLNRGSDLMNAEELACADYDAPDDLLVRYCERHQIKIDELILAVAAPVFGTRVDVTNSHWQFDAGALAAALGARSYLLINDFTAHAMAHRDYFYLGKLYSDKELECLRQGNGDLTAPVIVSGPGTGLGVAALIPMDSEVKVVDGEGGHASYSPRTKAEVNVFSVLQKEIGHVSAERIISGSGLETIYKIQNGTSKLASEIGASALLGDKESVDVVNLMLQSFATVLANVTLSFGARAGIIIVGGVVPKLAPLLRASGFFERLNDHGRCSPYLESMPIYLSRDRFAALRGGVSAFDNKFLQSKVCQLV